MIVKNEDGFVQKGKLFDAIWDGAEEKKLKTVRDVLQFLHDFPTADVVPVVRCKDCEKFKHDTQYCQEKQKGYCELDNLIKSKNHFCSYGERKGGAK